MTRVPSQQEDPQTQHSQPGSQGQGGQQQQGSSGPPTNEQLTQYLMIAKGLNRETAGQELAADPDSVKQEFEKVKQLMQSGGQQAQPQAGQGGQGGQPGQTGGQPGQSGQPGSQAGQGGQGRSGSDSESGGKAGETKQKPSWER